MNDLCILSLIELNQKFYLNYAAAFHKTRQHPWNGWDQLITFLPENLTMAVDIGCGNGRWLAYLESNGRLPSKAVGIDIDSFMLTQVRNRFSRYSGYSFFQADCTRELPKTLDSLIKDRVPLITSFGLWHHLPSYELRRNNLRQLADRLTSDGVLAVSLWQFADDPAYVHKLIKPATAAEKIGLLATEFEPGDYFLGWQNEQTALRYCHSFSDEEIERLASELGLPYRILIGSGNDRTNRYLVAGHQVQ